MIYFYVKIIITHVDVTYVCMIYYYVKIIITHVDYYYTRRCHIWCVRHVSGITFISSQNIGKLNNFKMFVSQKTKGPKQDSQKVKVTFA